MSAGSLGEDDLIDLRYPNEWMRFTQLQGKYGISEIMPVNDQFGIPDVANKECNCKCWYRWRILNKHPFCGLRPVSKNVVQAPNLPENFQRCYKQEKQLVAGLQNFWWRCNRHDSYSWVVCDIL